MLVMAKSWWGVHWGSFDDSLYFGVNLKMSKIKCIMPRKCALIERQRVDLQKHWMELVSCPNSGYKSEFLHKSPSVCLDGC